MKTTWFRRFQGWGLCAYTRLVLHTARYQIEGQKHVDRVHAAGRPLIIAAWHGMTMMLMGYLYSREDLSRYVSVVPDDPRGEVLSIFARRLGSTATFPISMEANSMVAARRLLAMIRQMKQGNSLYLNPDGPDGPTHEPKKGVVFIARKAGALIIPTGAFTTTAYHIPRWDRYTIPLPFSRIAILLAEPLEVPPGVDLEQARLALQERLNEAERAAEELYRTGRHSTG